MEQFGPLTARLLVIIKIVAIHTTPITRDAILAVDQEVLAGPYMQGAGNGSIYSMLPTDQQIKALHRKYARTDDDFELVYTHCLVVDAIAAQLLVTTPFSGISRELVHAGCMLHDIGAYGVLKNGQFVAGVRHGVIGEAVLREEGVSEAVYRFASHHTGVGLSEQDVENQKLPIPIANYMAETYEERLVMYADKFHSKSNPPLEQPYFCTFEWISNSIQQFGSDKIKKLDDLAGLFGKPDLVALSKQFDHVIKEI